MIRVYVASKICRGVALLGVKFAERLKETANLPKEFEENRIKTKYLMFLENIADKHKGHYDI
jgi:hypothetical protein